MVGNSVVKYSFLVFFIGLFVGLCVVLYRWGVSVGANAERQACVEKIANAMVDNTGRIETVEKEILSDSVVGNARRLCESDACVGNCKWENGACVAGNSKLSGTK